MLDLSVQNGIRKIHYDELSPWNSQEFKRVNGNYGESLDPTAL
jgi:hypothetical protein